MLPSLETIFNKFCEYLDRKVRWSEKKTDFTKLIFDFFSTLREENFTEERNYMGLDYILRKKMPKYSSNDIELAVEHEVSYRKPEDVISHETQHLIDIKAKYKIGIFYPTAGDEQKLRNEIEKKIKQASYLSVPWEEYLFIFGFPTTQAGKRSILFKDFHFSWERIGNYQNLKVKNLEEKLIKQKL